VGRQQFFLLQRQHAQPLRQAGERGGARIRGTSVTISGSGLDWHDMDSLLRPTAWGAIRSSATTRSASTNRASVRHRDHDGLQPVSDPSAAAGAFHDTVRKFAQSLARNDIKPVLFMSWAYKDRPEMTAQLAEQYTIAGNANDALVIPAGIAFAKAIAKRPDIELYQSDKRHPTLAGTYLAACTVYATLYRKSRRASSTAPD